MRRVEQVASEIRELHEQYLDKLYEFERRHGRDLREAGVHPMVRGLLIRGRADGKTLHGIQDDLEDDD